jgi:uncharacterized membrane protein YphA (DoxX/SURF4 family)
MWKRVQLAFWGLVALLLPVASAFIPSVVEGHEVYVLGPDQIQTGIATPPFSPIAVILGSLDQFAFWALAAIIVVVGVFFISISRCVEKALDPWLLKVKRYAPLAARVTGGLAFFMCAYHGALFGPELPLVAIFGAYAGAARVLLAVVGLLILAGVWVRAAAVIVAGLFVAGVTHYGWYMLTYTNYAGEIILLAIGAGTLLTKYRFLILRVAFGISLLYASLFAKFFHNYLALQVAATPLAGHLHTLAQNFGFEPHFLVVGAGIVEVVIALFFILGIEIRFTSIFLEFWLALSLLYFGEVVWPHLILIGIPIAFLLYGYDQYSLEGRFFKKGRREPVL